MHRARKLALCHVRPAEFALVEHGAPLGQRDGNAAVGTRVPWRDEHRGVGLAERVRRRQRAICEVGADGERCAGAEPREGRVLWGLSETKKRRERETEAYAGRVLLEEDGALEA